MGRIPDDDIQRVRDATDVVALISESVVLKKKGRLFWGLCPFHGEKTPSFKVDPGTQLWHCFGCGEGGDAFGFLMRRQNLDFPESVRSLADRGRVEIREEGESIPRAFKDRLHAAAEEAAAYYHHYLLASKDDATSTARDYLSRRGFGSEVAKRFELGFAPGRGALVAHLKEKGFTAEEIVGANLGLTPDGRGGLRDRFYERVMFPIRDLNGRAVGFGGRVLADSEPKYLNTQETPIFHKSQNLYAIELAKDEIIRSDGGTAIVVEGYTDVIALHEAGLRNAVATLGTALTRQHVRLLGRFAKRIVYLFDGDAAGMRAAERAADFADAAVAQGSGATALELRVAVVPGDSDPADYVTEHGAEEMQAVIAQALPLMEFVIERTISRHDLTTPEGRSRALRDSAERIAPLRGSLMGQDYMNYLADRLRTDYATVQNVVDGTRVVRSRDDGDSAGADDATPIMVDSPSLRAELALVGLVAAQPRLRSKARGLLDSDLLDSAASRRLLGYLVDAGTMPGAEVAAQIAETDEAGANLLRGLIEQAPGNEDTEAAASELLSKLKELSLERQIIDKKAEMRALDVVKDKAAYDDLFREVATLLEELDELHGGEGTPGDEEVWGQSGRNGEE